MNIGLFFSKTYSSNWDINGLYTFNEIRNEVELSEWRLVWWEDDCLPVVDEVLVEFILGIEFVLVLSSLLNEIVSKILWSHDSVKSMVGWDSPFEVIFLWVELGSVDGVQLRLDNGNENWLVNITSIGKNIIEGFELFDLVEGLWGHTPFVIEIPDGLALRNLIKILGHRIEQITILDDLNWVGNSTLVADMGKNFFLGLNSHQQFKS